MLLSKLSAILEYMPLVESLLSVIAPHNCLGCDREGSLLCRDCMDTLPLVHNNSCYKCNLRLANGMVCQGCRITSPLTAIRARTAHEGLAKHLVHRLKFERAIAAAKPMAKAMASVLPRSFHGKDTILVVPVPTASSRVRVRGYDQAACLARHLAKECHLPYQVLLGRSTQARQVGASRQQRITQLQEAFYVRKRSRCEDLIVILVDDVITTGSSMEASAAVLQRAGIIRVFGLAFARQPLVQLDESLQALRL